jgi:hypothetical protein
MTRTDPSLSTLTPLVELVALAASNGWQISTTHPVGELEWTRGANRIRAKFAASSHRPQYCALSNYTDYEGTRKPQLGTLVWRGVGNGGDSDGAIESLRKWFTLPVRSLTDPTQW